MGLLGSVKALISSWNGKRKRPDENEDDGKTSKRKRVNSYVLTPTTDGGKKNEVAEIRRCKHYYTYNEEIRSSETRTVEFKQGGVLFTSDSLIQLIGKYGPAFLNSEGGVLLAGVTDSGIVKGLSISKSDELRITAGIRKEIENFRPIVTSDQWSLDFVPVKDTGSRFSSHKVVVELSFKKGNQDELYENGSHQVFLRRDGGVQGPLRPLDIKNFVIAKYNETLKVRKGIASAPLDHKTKTPALATTTRKDNINSKVTFAIDTKTSSNHNNSIKSKKLSDEDEARRARLDKLGIKFIVIDED